LELRVTRHCANAQRVAGFLATHPAVARTLYPGLASHPQRALAAKQMSGSGNIVTFEAKSGKSQAFGVLNKLQLIDISNNLGDAKSLITHPWTTTHQSRKPEEKLAMGITEGLLRLSVGLEDVEDILADLAQALGG